MEKTNTNIITVAVFAFSLLVLIESFVFKSGNIFLVVVSGILIYYGIKGRSKSTLYGGLFFLLLAVFSLWSLRLFLVALLIYFLYKLWQGIPANELIQPIRSFTQDSSNRTIKNQLLSVQTTPFSSYEWEDIHIQGLFGNLHIDLTETVLPKGTSFISIRQAVGRIKIELPYEIPVRVHFTTLFGEAKILNDEQVKLLNESIQLKDGYDKPAPQGPEIIISIATWAGDLEVLRK